MSSIILKPIITEKANAEAEDFNRYSFEVDRRANKVQIAKEISKMYGVQVDSVNTMNYAGKVKRRHTKSGLITGKRNNTKKAVVTVAEGEMIDIYGAL